MKLLSLAAMTLVFTACAGAPTAPAETAGADEKAAEPKESNADGDVEEPAEAETDGAQSRKAPGLTVGDYHVHRFTGSFARAPLTLTEKVVARKDGAYIVDFSLEQAGKVTSLRVRYDANDTTRLLSVHSVDGETETETTLVAFEDLIARTVFAPDENLAQLDEEDSTCLVGEAELDCKKTRYQVMVGEKKAVLEIITSPSLRSRDLGGEVTSEDGKLLYRAQLVERGNDTEKAFLSRK